MSSLIERVHSSLLRRREALKNPIGSGLVVVCCERCGTPIATTKEDQAKGEPPILLDFPENARGWYCGCTAIRLRCAAMLFGWDPASYWNEKRCDRWFDRRGNRRFCDDHLTSRCRRKAAAVTA